MSTTYRHLIRQIRQGDETALEEMTKKFKGFLLSMIGQYGKITSDYDEIRTVTLFGFHEGIMTYDLSRDNPVRLHIYNSVRKYLNRERRSVTRWTKCMKPNGADTPDEKRTDYAYIVDTEAVSPEESYVLKEELCTFLVAISDLTAREQNVLDLYYSQDCSFTEIGKRLGLNRHTVSRIHDAAKEKLGRTMERMQLTAQPDLWDSIIESKGRVFQKNGKSRS